MRCQPIKTFNYEKINITKQHNVPVNAKLNVKPKPDIAIFKGHSKPV